MSYIYQVMIENTYIEEIVSEGNVCFRSSFQVALVFQQDLSFNNLGTNGICKVAEAIASCVQLKSLGVAGEFYSRFKHSNVFYLI